MKGLTNASFRVLSFVIRKIRSLRETLLVFVFPNKCEDKVIFAIKYFTNEIEVPHRIRMDTTRKDKSQKKRFRNSIGTA